MIKHLSTRSILLVLAALASTSTAFTSRPTGRVSTELYKQTKSPPPLPEIRDISYGEESRKYRRTVYTHDDWVNHRSPDRFFRNLVAIGSSGVYKSLAKEVVTTTSIATLIVIYNCIVGGYVDFEGVKHSALVTNSYLPVFALPLAPFTLASPSLGLLLGGFVLVLWMNVR